jgi:uncharacterized RDD family membrane protein YckC
VTDLVSGEAVVLELRLAKLPSRALAVVLDLVVQICLLLLVVAALIAAEGALDDAMAAAVAIVAVLAVLVGYPALVETLTRGRSLGKLALGLRVIRDDGGPIRFRHALTRSLAGFFVDFWMTFGTVGVISSLASARGKRVGDMLAGTVVLRERMPLHGGPVADMPPPLAQWASGLELSRLPDDLALAARQFLSRQAQLSPEVREDMARRLAADISQYVARQPPPGTSAATFLAAVVAERRNREMRRMMTQNRGAFPGAVGMYPAAPPSAGPVAPPPPAGQARREPAAPPARPPSGPPSPPTPPSAPAGGGFAPPG